MISSNANTGTILLNWYFISNFEVNILKNINWTALSSIAACVSAILSLVTIKVNIANNKKMYQANLEIKSKLDIIQSIKKLVPDYIAGTNYTLYLYSKAWSNTNDKRKPNVIIGRTEIADYDAQLTQAKRVYFELKTNLQVYEVELLLKEAEELWAVLNHENLYKISSTATNESITDPEQEVFDEFEEKKKKLIQDFSKWYKEEFQRLTK